MKKYIDIENIVKLVSKKDWNRIYYSLCMDGMEAVIFENGSVDIRPATNYIANNEAYKIPLDKAEWIDTLTDWDIWDYEENDLNVEASERDKNIFIKHVLKNTAI